MPIFPREMADHWARAICLKMVKEGKIPETAYEDCVSKATAAFSGAISDIDDRWAEGLAKFIGIKLTR